MEKLDNALGGLMAEIRKAHEELQNTEQQLTDNRADYEALLERKEDLLERAAELRRAMDDHVLNGTPVLQAKMIAKEQTLELRDTLTEKGNVIQAAKIAAGSITTSKINATVGAADWTNVR
ncbi:MAG: hypothetical protein BGP16_00975 [Sphingobium sp. 66-54]|nr:MAG: hypothetical protein BGP16_00975 [Sphingobium sp. 66-54]